MEPVLIRQGVRSDIDAICSLYKSVAASPGGLARTADEVTRQYVQDFVEHSLSDGLIFIAEAKGYVEFAGEIHAYRNGLKYFSHVLGGLTVAVHPEMQGRGVGKSLFNVLLSNVCAIRPEISRVELITQESNHRAMKLYESLGFKYEGRLEGAICSPNGGVEADIPMAWHRQPTKA
jgi:ribosomal protein S18 acetylase RimI-like enzyme